MTCVLKYIPRDNDRVDHFQVVSLTWHASANRDYKYGVRDDMRIRADAVVDAPAGHSASVDIKRRIMLVPEAQRTSSRVGYGYSDPF